MEKKKRIGRPPFLKDPSDVTVTIESKHRRFLNGYGNDSAKIREALDLLISKEEFDNA